eukprot:TRINITY_DN1654_c0_g2_i1.p1 TRINITY_DN1654_c0_g2~~TRINITY_DN1654_c0_g2_i1.p1  ORF type:complete len:388 (+),score=135.20 TRINITY_DN1654_c0_g2_i1:87-1250(+)
MAPASEEVKETFPDMSLAQKVFALKSGSNKDKATATKDVLETVKKNSMLPYYEKIAAAGVFVADETLKAEMRKKNDEELAKIEAKIQDCQENLGETETRDALLEKADFFNRIGDKAAALEAYNVAFEKTLGVGGRLDNILTIIRIAFFFEDMELAKKEIDRAKAELKKGGDWERRNKLKVYEGMYLMMTRSWKEAAELFLNVMPTFTATEIVAFPDFVFYTVVLSLVALDRKTLREKLVSSPEVLSAIKETAHLQEFMEDYYYCRYSSFMQHFVPIIDCVRGDRYLHRHCRYFMRIMRLNAFRQFLASYRSVRLDSMAQEFGVSSAFIDDELSSFISSGKLACKIDKVGGVIESNEHDARSQVYIDIIKQGDLLLNRMQKLSGALDM